MRKGGIVIMWKQKIGISIGSNYSIPTTELVKALRSIGFDAISPEWRTGGDFEEVLNVAREHGLFIQSLHAPFLRCADLWKTDCEASTTATDELIQVIQDCKKYSIPTVVAHVWIGFDYTFCEENLCFDNFDRVVDIAKECGVKIAFENTEGEEYLFALMQHYKDNDTVGFCWDSGHELCYNHSKDLLGLYGDRLYMTHLNDNLGISRYDGKIFWTDDLHLLPYDGIADWDNNVERLKKSRHIEYLNFELSQKSKPNRHENDIYAQMDIIQYFTEAYKQACKIAYKYSK